MSRMPVAALVVALSLAGPHGPAVGQPLRLEFDGGVAPRWQGLPAEESAGVAGTGPLYPAPNVGGFIAAILTHALIVQSGRSAELEARQQAADKVLDPYRDPIAQMTAQWLLEATRARLSPETLRLGDGLAVSMVPTFSMTPDRRAIILDNVIRVRSADNAKAARTEHMVRIVSTPRDEPDPASHWAAESGQGLREEAAAITAHSIEVALATPDLAKPGSSRTQRFRVGSIEKMERGQLVSGDPCRVVLRTLRDWLMSVPIDSEEGVVCKRTYAMPGSSLARE